MRERWTSFSFLALLGLVLAFALRVYRLGDQNVWWDEGITIWVVRHGFVEATLRMASDTHPPLYFWMLWPWIRLVGDGEFPARFLSVAFGLLTVALMCPAGRRLGGPWTGLLALWLLGFSRFHIHWSQEIRMYSLAALGVALTVYLALRIAETPDALRWWVAYAFAAAGMLLSLYLTVFVLIPQVLFLFLVSPRRRWSRALFAYGMVLALLGGWLAIALPRMATWSAASEPSSFTFVLTLSAVVWVTGVSTFFERFLGPVALVWVGIAAGLGARVLAARGPAERTSTLLRMLLLGGGLAVQPVAVWLVTQPRSFLYTPRVEARYFVHAVPLVSLLLAWAFTGFLRWKGARGWLIIGGTGVMFLTISVLPDYYMARHWEADRALLAHLIRVYAREGDGVILVSGDRFPEFLYEYERSGISALRPPVYQVPRLGLQVSAESVEAELRDIVARHPRIWLARVESHLQDPEGWVERWLDAHLVRALTFSFGHNALILYAPSPEEPEVPFQNMLHNDRIHLLANPPGALLGYDQLGRIFRPGDTVRVGLYVRANEPLSWRIEWVRRPDEILARQDLEIPPSFGILRRQVELQITPYTPSGRYMLRIHGVGASPITIGEFQVERTIAPPSLKEIQHPMSARLGDHIRFLGYSLSGVRKGDPPVATAGSVLILDLFWEAEEPIPRSYVVFTHVVGEAFNPATGNPVWAQDDQVPMEGAYPTTHWIPKRPLRDRYELRLPRGIPPGEYILEIGMYALETGERLPVSGEGADPAARRLILTRVRVLP